MKRVLTSLLSIIISCIVIIGLSGCNSEKETEDPLNNPSEEYVISCLKKVPYIDEIKAVTEDNDPNGQLNKDGGYTAQIYFSYELVNQDDVYGETLIDKGTSAGGSIEVYKTEDDANKRNDYLSSFDGGILSSGSHTVVGTIVVRTSSRLTATQQKVLESNIVNVLNGQYDKIVTPQQSPNKNNDDIIEESNTGNQPEDNGNSNIGANEESPNGNEGTQEENPNQPEDEKANAIIEAESYASEFEENYPDDYFTPWYVKEYLQDVYEYSEEVVYYAIENCNIDWASHAEKIVQIYLTYTEEFASPASWWRPSDIESILLEYEFSQNIVDTVMSEIDWDAQVVKYLSHLSDFYDTFNRVNARSILEDIIANEDGINYVLENSGIDWNKHALNMANELWAEYSEYYNDEGDLLSSIENELSEIWEYTESETAYAIENISR